MIPTMYTEKPPDFMKKAACIGLGDIFLPDPLDRMATKECYKKARPICRKCPVLAECREYALSMVPRPDCGMWAGMDPDQLLNASRKARRRT